MNHLIIVTANRQRPLSGGEAIQELTSLLHSEVQFFDKDGKQNNRDVIAEISEALTRKFLVEGRS